MSANQLMFRFAIILTLCLLVAFTGVGLLVSREWGWPEYASDELYVVYSIGSEVPYTFSLVNTDGSDEKWPLMWNQGYLTQFACSPDGHTFAFLTDAAHLYVATSSGILYDRPEDQIYSDLRVANDGVVALFDRDTGKLKLGMMLMNLSSSDHLAQLDHIDIDYQGLLAWSLGDRKIIHFLSPNTGTIVWSLPNATFGAWLAPERLFTFYASGMGWFVFDPNTQRQFQSKVDLLGFFSPDGTKRAASFGLDHGIEVFLMDAFGERVTQRLTHSGQINQALCFLTFRPQMLIAENQ